MISGAALSIVGLTKHFGEVPAVEDFNLEISAGEFLSILGRSGSGKTTVLRIVAGLEIATSGEIFIGGRPAIGLPPEARGIGMVFQDYALFPHMSVWDNIAFPLRMRGQGRDQIRRQVAESMELVNLGGLERRKPSQLSGGQQQRVALARALAFGPQLLLLDEPLSALDKHLRERMKAELKALHRRVGVTVVYVTHDQSEALALSDRIVVMHDGHVEGIDSPERLYELPSSRYIASFVGDANLFDGEIAAVKAGSVDVTCRLGTCAVPTDRMRLAAEPKIGLPVTFVARPEAILIGGFARNKEHTLTIDCEVVQVLYGGVSNLYVLRLAGEPPVEFSARVTHLVDGHLGPGSRTCAHIALDRCVLVPR
jgi:putative spermidine/putrescine transport system ATP-binding protein